MTDDRIVALVRRGDERAFTLLVERYRARLVRYAATRLSCDDAEDVVQEALVRAHAALRAGSEPESLVGWLHAIVRNGAFDARRRQARHQAGPLEDDLLEGGEDTEAVVARRLRVQDTLEGLRALPPRQREALAQVAVGGLSYDEVAVSQDTSVTAIKALVNRARVNLRRTTGALGLLLPPLRKLGGVGGVVVKVPVLIALVAGAAVVPGFSISVPAVGVPPAVAQELGAVRAAKPSSAATVSTPTAVPPSAAHPASTARIVRACSSDRSLKRYDTASLVRARGDLPADVAEYTDCDGRLARALAP